MNIISDTGRKHPLSQPMLMIAGLACGIISGLALSLLNAPGAEDSRHYAAPVNMHMADNSHSLAAGSASAAEQFERTETVVAGTSAATPAIDPASAYLSASKSLAVDSKILLASISNSVFQRPDWSWSRDTYSVSHAGSQRVFGVNAQSANDTASMPASSLPATAATVAATATAPAVAASDIVVPDTIIPGFSDTERLVVVLDPGHGGIDPGSKAPNGLIEKELTLDMAQRVELFLSEIDNVDVVMTRTDDVGMSRQHRVDKIQTVGADIVVSLHFNHLPQTDINLVETFYADRHNIIESLAKQKKSPASANLDYTDASRTLAHIMHQKVYAGVANANTPGAVIDAGVKRDTLFVLTRSFTPGVLLELTCISNPAEAERLTTPEYRNQLAASIADGLRDYVEGLQQRNYDELLVKVDL